MDDELYDDDGLLEPEIVEEIVVIEAATPLAPLRPGPPAIVQAAAVAATSFVAGAAAATMLSRRRSRQTLVPARATRALPRHSAGTTETFLVHVQSIRRP
jgi:hypothetical protein